MTEFIQGAFRNKAAVIILVVMALGLGILSYTKLPMELLPEADNPQVTISVIGPGYDAATMERSVTTPLEQALSAIRGKTNAFSTSGDGFSQINLNFDSNADMKEAKAEVERAVAAVPLPERVSPPYVVQFNTSMIPISFVSMTFDDGISEAAKQAIEEKALTAFQAIEGVGTVQLSGKSQPKVSIVPDPAKLADKGVPLQALYGVLQGRDASASLGASVIEGEAASLNVASGVADVEALRKLTVVPGVALADVADVSLVDDKESVSRVDGKEALMFVVSKGASANAVNVGDGVAETVEQLNADYKDAELKVLLSTSEQIVHSVNSMLREVLMGALFATIVILLFMRNWRATLVTIVSIPLSLGVTLYLLDLSGITLNILTLGGVAVAVGRLVDDSIVVIENIFRRLQHEKFSRELIVDATREVARAITASTLTTVAVFLPMGLLDGSLRSFLLPFALTVTYSLLSSLLVALTVIPLMSAGVLKTTTIKEHRPSRWFGSFLAWNLRYKWVTIVLAFALLAGSLATFAAMPKGAVDSSSASDLGIKLEYKPDTPVDEVLASGMKLESFLLGQDDAEWVSMDMGNNEDSARYGSIGSPTIVNYQVHMKEGADAQPFIDAVKGQAEQYPGAELTVAAANFFGSGGGSSVFVDVSGRDAEQLALVAEQVIGKIEPIDDVIKVESNQEAKKTVYTLQVDAELARAGDIAGQLQGMLNAAPIGTLVVDDQPVPVVVEPVLKPSSAGELNGVSVMTDAGPQPLSAVAQWVKSESATQFYHKDGVSYVRVTAEVEPSRLSVVGSEIKQAMAEFAAPEGIEVIVGGASADQSDDFADLFAMMLVSIGIVYLIMVVTFKNLRAPLAILSSLLFVPIGSVLGLVIAEISPDFTAIFGVVMLVGIVVTNAIVLIDRVRHNEETMTIREALLEAASTRMRPILMTATATVCAMLPLVFGSTESGSIVSQSLAIVVIGGLVVATLLTLVIVPCIYELLFFRKSARQRRAGADGRQVAA